MSLSVDGQSFPVCLFLLCLHEECISVMYQVLNMYHPCVCAELCVCLFISVCWQIIEQPCPVASCSSTPNIKTSSLLSLIKLAGDSLEYYHEHTHTHTTYRQTAQQDLLPHMCMH